MDCRLVLVETNVPENLGAAARVLRNFGFSDLVLVRPAVDPLDPRALHMSTHGEAILRAARSVADLSAALADRHVVVGTSARTGGLFRKQTVGSAREILPKVAVSLAEGAKAALVFGSETNGLTLDDIARCHYLLRIPAAGDYPALNLAQAVAVCLYELRCCLDAAASPASAAEARASVAELERMFAHLEQALRTLHFLYGEKADALMHGLRHLLARAGPTPMEVKLLHGLARQIEFFAGEDRRG